LPGVGLALVNLVPVASDELQQLGERSRAIAGLFDERVPRLSGI
jgi:hypothetical protein